MNFNPASRYYVTMLWGLLIHDGRKDNMWEYCIKLKVLPTRSVLDNYNTLLPTCQLLRKSIVFVQNNLKSTGYVYLTELKFIHRMSLTKDFEN